MVSKGFPNVTTSGRQYNIGEKPPVILYTSYIINFSMQGHQNRNPFYARALDYVGGDNVGRPKVKGGLHVCLDFHPQSIGTADKRQWKRRVGRGGGRHLRANGEEGTRGGARGRRLLKVGQAVAAGSRKDVGRSLGRKYFGGLDRTKLFACRRYGLVSQLFIVDAGVSLELLFSVFVGQCACLYVLDDSFRFCISARKLSFIYLITCRRNDVASNKKMQSIHQCMGIVTNEEQHHLHYFRTSVMYKIVGESNTFVCLSAPPMENLLAGWSRKKNETYNVPADVL